MGRVLSILFIGLLCGFSAQAQHILTGKVTDADTKQPIAGVVVYLDGTSHKSTTDNEGNFVMQVEVKTKSNLIYSHVSYRLTAMPDPFNQPNQSTTMKPKKIELQEVIIDGDKKQKRAFDYDRRMKAFKQLFLGDTDAGRSCKILNEEDINLVFDNAQRILYAYASKPIKYVNDYLGYTVEFTLLNFKAQYFEDANNLDEFNVGESYFAGFTMYNDDKPTDLKTNNNRTKVFDKSATNFFRNLVSGRLYDNTLFRIFSGGKAISPNDYFVITDTLGLKMVTIIPEQIEAEKLTKSLPKGVCAKFFTTYGGTIETEESRFNFDDRERDLTNLMRAKENHDYVDLKEMSQIFFMTNAFLVDQYGNLEDPNVVRFSGALAQVKAGDMLPEDFVPRLTSDVRKEKKEEKNKPQ